MSSLHFLFFLKWPPGERDTNTSVAFDELVDEILEDEALERLFQSIIDADVGDENRALNRWMSDVLFYGLNDSRRPFDHQDTNQ